MHGCDRAAATLEYHGSRNGNLEIICFKYEQLFIEICG